MRIVLPFLLLAGCSYVSGSGIAPEDNEVACLDAEDNDDDGLYDCGDPDCTHTGFCPTADEVKEVNLLGTCFRGWTFGELDTIRTADFCEPWNWGEGRSQECGVDLQVPAGDGLTACAPVVSRSGVDACSLPFPQPDGLRFVRVGEAGGDGSYDRPYGTIAEAAADPTAETILFDGEVSEPVVLGSATSLYGTCPSRARLLAGIRLEGEGAFLRDVSIRAPDGASDALWDSGTASIVEDSIVEGPVRLEGELTMRASRVRGPIRVVGAAKVALHGVQIDAESDPCLTVSGSAELDAVDVVISRCPSGAVRVSETARVVLEHTAIDDIVGAGPGEPEPEAIVIECDETEEPCLELRNSIVRGGAEGGTLVGVHMLSGDARFYSSVFPAVEGVPWDAHGTPPDPPLGRAVWVEGGYLLLQDVLINGLQVDDSNPRDRLPDVMVQVGGGTLDINAARLQTFARIGIDVSSGGELMGNDLRVVDLVVPTRFPNLGIKASAGAAVQVRTFEVKDTRPCAFFLDADVNFFAQSGVITDTTNGFCIPEVNDYDLRIWSTTAQIGVREPIHLIHEP